MLHFEMHNHWSHATKTCSKRDRSEVQALSFVKQNDPTVQRGHFTKVRFSASNRKYRQKLLYFEIISDSFSKKNTTKADIEHFFTQQTTHTRINKANQPYSPFIKQELRYYRYK